MSPIANSAISRSRIEHRPGRVRTLFVGESPPANGTFFYFGNSLLSKQMQRALGEFLPHDDSVADFLRAFQREGFWLVDLCEEPLNKLSKTERRNIHRLSELALSRNLLQWSPEAVVVVKRDIVPSIERALQLAGQNPPLYSLPFPAMGHQNRFIRELQADFVKLPRNSSDC